MATNNVSVAVRIRPKLQKEVIDMCNICTRVTPGEPQIWLGHDKAFTFDHVFDCDAKQGEIYENCVENLVDGCFDGYNATVLAYGQTGSGKTYSMGTGFDVSCPDDQLGIIPRAVRHLFAGINRRKEEARQNDLPLPEFSVTAQFIEIYNEELIDLLCEKSKKGGGANGIRIQEDLKRGIILTGVKNKPVSSVKETLACLKNGSLFRTTGSTLMNAESSRSHAIFTLFVKQSRVDRVKLENAEDSAASTEQELITLTAKFNFVDLAGSERMARTGAVGERAREGISTNSGLLHLGNVISALGDRSKKASHIPYRNSKLTRVLQDSLGGNSVTTMIACVSPCDLDSKETLNTLRYANRAKNIKNKVVANKVVANQDSQTQLITELRKQVMLLEQQNKELRQGKLLLKSDGELEMNDVHLENEMRQQDLNHANTRIKALSTRLNEVPEENVTLQEQIAMNQVRNSAANGSDGNEDCAEHLIKGYLKEINELRSKVMESETIISNFEQFPNFESSDDIVSRCKQEVEQSKAKLSMLGSVEKRTAKHHLAAEEHNNDDKENNGETDDEVDEHIEEEFEKNIAGQNAELAALMAMIASKEKLIEEAEARQRIIQLTEHYEQKITSFQTKIKQTEGERDRLMSKLKANKDDLNLKKVKEDFEKKLSLLQQDVRKFEALKRERQKVVREEHNSEEMLKKMRQMVEAKHQHVRMIWQMREQMAKHNKEI
ncbi:Kinesin-like protein kif21b [Tyrophagus putrescentiae]|nr:Kinesin-like protein kif21b [Tyrophagus putrescentiae]